MPYNGSGVFTRLYSWVNDAAANIKIRADRMDNEMNGMAVALSTAITKDGQTTITANLPMSSFRHTGVGNAASRTDYAAFGQVQDGKAAWVDGGGTADAITAAYSIPITALVDGQLCYVRATAANVTTTPTFSPNGLTARTIVKNGGQALVAGDISGDGHELELRYDLANTRWELMNPRPVSVTNPVLNGTITGSASPKINNFRLTLTTDVPVTTTDVTGASTVFLTPYNGNQIALYNGTAWELLTTAQVSLALSGLTSGRPYDVFAYNNAGTVTLETLVWTNDTTRATALAYQDGVLVRSGSTTRRYLGTFYSTGTTTTEDSAKNRYLANYYNTVRKNMSAAESTASWTYSTAAYRQWNNATNAEVSFIQGVAENAVECRVSGRFVNSTATARQAWVAIGLNSATALWGNASIETQPVISAVAASGTSQGSAFLLGKNTFKALEYGAGADTQTWYGTPQWTTGISGSINV